MAPLTLLALTACSQPLHLEDDVGPQSLLGRDTLHLPYVRGADVDITAQGRRSGRVDERWSLRSSDDRLLVPLSVVPPEEDQDMSWAFHADAVGTAALSLVRPDGEVVHSEDVVIAFPDEIRLSEATLERTDLPTARPETCTFQVVVGGVGGLVATYFRDGEQLYGNRVLTLGSDDPVDVSVDHSFLDVDRDWPLVQPLEAGEWDVMMAVDGDYVDTFRFAAVPPEAIASVGILADDEDKARDGDVLDLFVQSYDSRGCPIMGVEWTWFVDGQVQLETGDMYTYEYDRDDETEIVVTYGDLRQQTTVHGQGDVGSSQLATCSSLPGVAAAMSLWMLVAGVLVSRREED